MCGASLSLPGRLLFSDMSGKSVQIVTAKQNVSAACCLTPRGFLQIFASLLQHAQGLGLNTTSAMASAATRLQQAEAAVADMDEKAKEDLSSSPEDEEPISLALLQEEVVMFQRAISRLHEMCKVQAG